MQGCIISGMSLDRTKPHPSRALIYVAVALFAVALVMIPIGVFSGTFGLAIFGAILMGAGVIAALAGAVWNSFSR